MLLRQTTRCDVATAPRETMCVGFASCALRASAILMMRVQGLTVLLRQTTQCDVRGSDAQRRPSFPFVGALTLAFSCTTNANSRGKAFLLRCESETAVPLPTSAASTPWCPSHAHVSIAPRSVFPMTMELGGDVGNVGGTCVFLSRGRLCRGVAPPPPQNILSICGFCTGPWTVTRSALSRNVSRHCSLWTLPVLWLSFH